MASPHDRTSGAGWFPDPAGLHQWRYFDGSWTDLISDDGRTGRAPLPGQDGPAITGATLAPQGPGTSTGVDAPARPTPPGSEPGFEPVSPPGSAPSPAGRRRALIVGVAVAAVVVVVVGIVLATNGGGTGDDQAGADSDITGDFCADFPANYGPIESAWQTATTVAHDLAASADRDHDVNQLAKAAALTRRLAAEAPDTTDEFGDALPGVIDNWADFFAATQDLAADDGSDYQKHSGLLDRAQQHESESTPSLLKQAMFPDPGLPAARSCS